MVLLCISLLQSVDAHKGWCQVTPGCLMWEHSCLFLRAHLEHMIAFLFMLLYIGSLGRGEFAFPRVPSMQLSAQVFAFLNKFG